jgi:uncharacterized protein (DUF2141 family)
MKKTLLFFIVLISLNLYPKGNSTVSGELISTCAVTNSWCNGSNSGSLHIVALGGQSPYTYSINNGPFQSIIFDSFDLSPGTYNIITKDALGATVFNSVVITEPAILHATVTVSGQNLTANVTGGTTSYSYWLTKNGSLIANAQASNTFSNLPPGTYSVSIKDNNGCLAIVDATIVPPIVGTVSNIVHCFGDNTFDLTSRYSSLIGNSNPNTTNVSYHLTLDDAIRATNTIGNPTNYLNTATTKTIYARIDNLGSISYSSFNLTSNPELVSSTLLHNLSCNGSNDGSIIINASGGQTPYTYSVGYGYQSSNTFSGLSAGTYNITTIDALGCFEIMTINIMQPSPLNAAITITKPIDCISNATVTVAATGGTGSYTYSKDGGITYIASNVFTDLTPGTYSVYVKDSNGCIITSNTITIAPLNSLVATTTKSDINCKGDNSGSISVIATGGQTPYTYSIGNGYQASNTFTGLSAGTYEVIIRDAFNCILETMPIYIVEPVTPLVATVETKGQTITINTQGGTGIIKYAISPNVNLFTTNNTFTNLAPGIYTIIAQDENGCSVLLTSTINPPAPLVNGKNAITFIFKLGQTLADIIIDLQNIKWYIKASASTNKTGKTSETELPLTTVLVEGTTYYASQTINGIESTERLAVTTKSSTLGTNDFDFQNLAYYPNPVKNILTLSNTSTIDEVILTSIKGETLLTKKINALHSEIDLSNFSTGVYFLKVKSEGKEKTMKIIKE